MKLRDALAAAKTNAFARFDSWVNELTGFSTWRDKTTYGHFDPSARISDEELSAIYHGDDMGARMVDIVPQEMLREGFSVATQESTLDATLLEGLERLRVRERVADAIRWARLYGGSGILLGADDGRDASAPLVPEDAEDLKYLYVIDRRMLWPLEWYPAGHPKFGEPRIYSVTTFGGSETLTANVHESRLVLFRGAPTGIYERARWASWDLSVLQRPYEILRQFNVGWKAVEVMFTDANQGVFKMSGFADMIASGEQKLLRDRLQINELYRSVVRALVVDAESNEGFERQATSFTDIPATLEKLMLRLSAAVQIPVTILMGQSPAGMNATGESDFRWFYDRIRAEQTTMLAPRLRRIIDVMLRVRSSPTGGVVPKTLTIEFPPLWSETPLAEAQRRQAIATADASYVQAGILLPEEVALSRFTPQGFGDEIVLTKEGRSERERALSEDLAGMQGGQQGDPEGETEARPSGDEDIDPPAAGVRGDADWNESDHPREKDGRFGKGAGGPVKAKDNDAGAKGGGGPDAARKHPWNPPGTKASERGKWTGSRGPSKDEERAVDRLLSEGNSVHFLPEEVDADGTSSRTPDIEVNGRRTELKAVKEPTLSAFRGAIRRAKGRRQRSGEVQAPQASHVVIDVTDGKLSQAEAERVLRGMRMMPGSNVLEKIKGLRIIGHDFDAVYDHDNWP